MQTRTRAQTLTTDKANKKLDKAKPSTEGKNSAESNRPDPSTGSVDETKPATEGKSSKASKSGGGK
jgi:hypothetical protein